MRRGGGMHGSEEQEYNNGVRVRPPHATQKNTGEKSDGEVGNRTRAPPNHYRQYEKGATEL